ncbi:MAG: phosphotransferase [Chloroflexi bacterium]|nr:phosphotransferase [Chloroflexota bacterium]
MRTPTLSPRPVASSVDELLAGATDRQPFIHNDSKSGAGFDRVRINGQPHVLKYVHIDHDWTMRFFHETSCIPLDVWRAGLMDVLPEHLDHGMVGAAAGFGRDGLGAALLMRDLTPALVPPGDEPLAIEAHLQVLDGLAALAARMWGWRDTVGLLPLANRWLFCNDADIEAERELGWPNAVPKIAAEGWMRFFERAPRDVCSVIRNLRFDTRPLAHAVATTPLTFVHGDWKLGNLGLHGDGRVVLIDWTYCGEGPVCFDLGWYLALNAARLPQSKEDSITVVRQALEARGIPTDAWWERQLGLCLLGTLVMFGWEKALGNEDELSWWCDRAREGARYL